MLVSTTLVAIVLGLFGAVVIGLGLVAATAGMAVVASAMVTVAGLLATGVAACLRTWRHLHEPGLLVWVLASAGCLLYLLLAALFAATSVPWLIWTAPPPLAVTWALLYFRVALHHRDTCAAYLWLPTRILAKLKPDAAAGTIA